jgi:hypothetical protein
VRVEKTLGVAPTDEAEGEDVLSIASPVVGCGVD